jgi:hypothetical protein
MAVGVASPTPLNVLAGIAGQGGTPSLAWFAPQGTALPADATTALAAAYLNSGYVAESGLTISTATNSTDINAYGVSTPVRTLVTSQKKTGQLTFLETNAVTQAIYRKMPLPGQTGAATVTATTGAVAYTEGPARVQTYVGVFTATDGNNIIRKVCPLLQVTDQADEVIAQSGNIQYGVTFTAYPDSTGVAIYTYLLVPNLATA